MITSDTPSSLLQGLGQALLLARGKAQRAATQTLLSLVNRQLRQQTAQGLPDLREHAGQRFRLLWDARRFDLLIQPDGLLQRLIPAESVPTAQADDDVDLSIHITTAQLIETFGKGQPPSRVRAQLHGDMALARTLAEVLQALRWDYESDCVALFGEVLGTRLARGVRAGLEELGYLRQRARDDVQAWFSEAPRGLVTQGEFAEFAAEVRALRDAVARAGQRLGSGT